MILSINENIKTGDTTFTFDKDESRHLIKVLRKKIDDSVFITNGKGDFFTGKINIASDKKCLVDIIKTEHHTKNRNYHLHIAIAPTKLNDRYEWFLEKATEIGIDEITPIICANSERKMIKLERMTKIIQSATKQSLQFHMPKLNEPVKLNEFIKQCNNTTKLIAHCEDDQEKNLLSKLTPSKNICVLIGPEGDFSVPEIKKALENGFDAVSLGENRLRTETAGIYATTVISTLNL